MKPLHHRGVRGLAADEHPGSRHNCHSSRKFLTTLTEGNYMETRYLTPITLENAADRADTIALELLDRIREATERIEELRERITTYEDSFETESCCDLMAAAIDTLYTSLPAYRNKIRRINRELDRISSQTKIG
jgi:hypothetical protein